MYRKLIPIFIALLAAPLAWAQETPAEPETSEADLAFMELLQRLQDDAKAREAVRGLIQLRIEELRSKTGAEKTEVEKLREDLDAKYTRVEELKNQVDQLSAQLESARAELLDLDLQIPEITRQIEAQEKKHAEFAEPLSVYERSLKLLDALSAPPAEEAPAEEAPAEAAPAEPAPAPAPEAPAPPTEPAPAPAPPAEPAPAPAPPAEPAPAPAPPTPAEPPASTTPPEPAPAALQQPAPEWGDVVLAADKEGDALAPVNFNREIRHILSNNCFACHGFDENTRKAGLRLDVRDSAIGDLPSGGRAIVPGDRTASLLWQRITTHDEIDQMPPADSGKKLTAAQIDLLGRWIDEGAEYQQHWAFIKPERPAPPEVASGWAQNPIDRFIAKRLLAENLSPAPEADKRTLIRRATLDLTGLPPTVEEVEAFVQDNSADAYDRLLDRLFASPRYGEQMARYWLDVSRYADTNGYHIDNERYMWRWRDWVIDAYNRNMPFDEFTVEQLAGDLLPEPTLDQRIATGFNRNHMINFEGGAIPEEYHNNYLIDRVNTTSTTWLGLTMNCAQCHDHKFDPISQKEFYEFYAFFNTVPEQGLDGVTGNSVPFIKAPLPDQQRQMEEIRAQITKVEEEMNAPVPDIDSAQVAWEAEWRDKLPSRWTAVALSEYKSSAGASFKPLDDGSILIEGESPESAAIELVGTAAAEDITAIRLEALADPALQAAEGQEAKPAFVLGEVEIEVAPLNDLAQVRTLKLATANVDDPAQKLEAVKAVDGNAGNGWSVNGPNTGARRVAVFIPDKPFGFSTGTQFRIRLRDAAKHQLQPIGRFRVSVASDPTMAPSALGPWYVNGPFQAADGKAAYETAFEPETTVDLEATYEDHRRKWTAPGDLSDGQIHALFGDNCATYLYRTITAPTAREAILSVGSNDALKVWLNEQVVLDKNVLRGVSADQDQITVKLAKGENRLLMKVVNYGNDYAFFFRNAYEQVGEIPLQIEEVLAAAALARTPEQANALKSWYRREHWPRYGELETELAGLRAKETALDAEIPTTMVMSEMESPRETFVLKRGAYDAPGEKVTPLTPAALPPFAEDMPANRLGLARWLVSPDHPLTARVVVNRMWGRLFGTGIVKTVEDFGIQGEWPSHPELLDWLAVEFVESGWDMQHMLRLMMTSETYRQSSAVTPDLDALDPDNRLLARGPRFRMDAEMVRDLALASSGLLVDTIGGPSVYPYQPKGIWEAVAYGSNFTAQRYVQGTGDQLYRRSMYTFWKRQSPPPMMLLFDAPNREVCTARRERTNTPLQALALLNSPQFVEASRNLAQRALLELDADMPARIAYAFEIVTARPPTEEELAVLVETYETQLAEYEANAEAAKKLLEVGDSAHAEGLDIPQAAALSTVTSIILNLDEAVTKG